MKLIAFELKMCNIGSWNGKWTGEGRRYIEVRRVENNVAEKILPKKSYHHSWGDGWACNIHVTLIDSKEKRKLSKHFKNGFCGYGWMIDNIIDYQSTREPRKQSAIDFLT